MNSLVLAAVLCCAIAATQAQDVLPAWLPPMQPYACIWCSGRYYRRSPQALTTGRPAVGSASAPSSDLALHAGFFYDIIPKYSVKNEKSACIYLVNMYRKDKGPVAATEIMSYINMSFFGPQQTKDYSDKPHPLTFQCCHYKFGRQLMDKINTVEENEDVVVSTTVVPDETTATVTEVTEVTTATTDRPRLTGRIGAAKKHTNKKSKKPAVHADEEGEEEVSQQQRRKRQSENDDEIVTAVKKQQLKKRNSLRVPTKVESSVVVVDDTTTNDDNGDKYKARMPDILPEGFTCDTLTRQLYMELSQDNETRQKQIQKAMQRNVQRTARRHTNY